MRSANIILFNDPNQAYPLLAQGYKVLLCTEDLVSMEVDTHPNTLRMSVLLPPYEVVSMEINGDINGMSTAYINYLMQNKTTLTILRIIYLSVYQGNPVALCFGSEINDLHFGEILINCFSQYIGLTFIWNNTGFIDDNFIIPSIRDLYLGGEINTMQALSYYPQNVSIDPNMIMKLIQDLNPPVQINDMNLANQYFMQIINEMKGQDANTNGQQYYCPFELGSGKQ